MNSIDRNASSNQLGEEKLVKIRDKLKVITNEDEDKIQEAEDRIKKMLNKQNLLNVYKEGSEDTLKQMILHIKGRVFHLSRPII